MIKEVGRGVGARDAAAGRAPGVLDDIDDHQLAAVAEFLTIPSRRRTSLGATRAARRAPVRPAVRTAPARAKGHFHLHASISKLP